MNKILLTTLSAISLSFTAAHATSAVEIRAVPESPIVFTSDYTMPDPAGNPKTIKAPYFAFRVHIKNNAVDDVTFVGLHVEVTGVDTLGKTVSLIRDITPSEFSYTTTVSSCTFADFGQFDSKGTFNDRNLFLGATPGSTAGCGGEATFIIENLPSIGNSASMIYQVKIQPLGWFG